jgi:hypothetical protein
VAAASSVSWARRIGYWAPTIIIANGSPALWAPAPPRSPDTFRSRCDKARFERRPRVSRHPQIVRQQRNPPALQGALRLGFPVYFAVLLGVWKILGAIAILLPRFPLLKEWAYAGIFFDLTGAAVASAATGLPWWHVAAPLVITLVAVLSWSLRPHDRTVTGQVAVANVAG